MNTRTKLFNVAIIFALLLCLNSCAVQRLSYKFEKGKTYKYSTNVATKILGQAAGQEFTVKSDVDCDYSMTTTEAKEHEFTLLVTYDKFDMKINMPMMGYKDSIIVMKEYIGKRVKVKITDLGKTTSVEPVDTIQMSNIQMMIGMNPSDLFQRLLFELPDKELNLNSTWKKNEPDTTKRMGMNIITKPNIICRVDAKEKVGDLNCWKIILTGTGTMEGSGKQRGVDLTIDGKNKFNGSVYLSPEKGIFVSSDQSIENDMTVTVIGTQTAAQTMLTTIAVKTKLMQ